MLQTYETLFYVLNLFISWKFRKTSQIDIFFSSKHKKLLNSEVTEGGGGTKDG